LVRTEGDELVAIDDDDPLYEQFDGEVFADAYLRRLLDVFEHTTESFLATNTPTSLPQTIANRLVIVVDSREMGVLRNVTVHHNEGQVPIELAIGVGHDGSTDLDWAQQNLARAMAPLLLELVGLKRDQPEPSTRPSSDEAATPAEAFWLGFEAALEAEYGQQHPEPPDPLHTLETLSPAGADRLSRPRLPEHKDVGILSQGTKPTSERGSPEEASRTPGVVGAFLHRLLKQVGSFYPQRHMLWFVSFEPDEIPYGKFLLAVSRVPRHRDVSVQTFIETYVETFPAERASVVSLAEQVLGRSW